MCNRYLVRVHHPVEYGIDLEVVADDATEAATMALAECPAETYLERVYPLENDVLEEDGVQMTARILSSERMVARYQG